MIGSSADLIAFAIARGVTLDTTAAAVALQKSTDYLNGLCWIGTKTLAGQRDAWPRTDDDGTDLGLPDVVADAAYRLAMDASKGVDLMPTFAGKQVLRERVEGAVDMTYAESTLYNGPVFPWLDGMIGEYLKCEEASGINFPVFRG